MKLTKYYTFGEWWKFVSSYPDWSINTSPMGFKDSGDIITSFMGAISTFSGSVYTGAKKVSKYLGNYLHELGILEDHRNDSKYSDWDKAYELHNKELNEK